MPISFRLLTLWLFSMLMTHAAEPLIGLIKPDGNLVITDDTGDLLALDLTCWGPNWAWTGLGATLTKAGGGTDIVFAGGLGGNGGDIRVDAHIHPLDARHVRCDYVLSSEKGARLTQVVITAMPGSRFHGKDRTRVVETEARTIETPYGRSGLGQAVHSFTLTDGAGGQATTIAFTQPANISSDGAARFTLRDRDLAAGEMAELHFTIELPAPMTWYATPADIPQEPVWDASFVWEPRADYDAPSAFGMSDWLDKPAGRLGRVKRDGDHLSIGGKPAKFWGINLCFANCAPAKGAAEQRAKMYAKYGINAVRLHKFADGPGWAGIQSEGSFAEFDATMLDQMDYFVAKLKEQGIYVELSPTFQLTLGAKDRTAVPYLDEVGQLENKPDARVRTSWGSVYLGRELQDLQIKQTISILTHKNPYTGLTYAEDPAVMLVEMFNEDSALFYGTMGTLQTMPTLRKRGAEGFSDWLKAKYKTDAALIAAWGDQALNSFVGEGFTGESLAARTIVPAGNPWFYEPEILDGPQCNKKARLFDTMHYLYELQNAFYKRFGDAMRTAGYSGEIMASNWQAGRAYSHFYNLHTDYLSGLIDRHNYWNGPGSMLARAGGGILSTGMQQVADRPFMVSEWVHCTPNEWGAEGPAIIGAYGMGLQGWDVSFIFQNSDPCNFIEKYNDTWCVAVPQHLGLFPAVARQVLRGDVKEAPTVSTRFVHVPSLHDGKLGFDDRVTQSGDIKSIDSSTVSARALAAGRLAVGFVDAFKETPVFDLKPFEKSGAIESVTKQLHWYEGTTPTSGVITIDTAATKAVVGFASGMEAKLGDVVIASHSRFAAIYVTAAGRNETIVNAKCLLVVAVARCRNTGQKMIGDRVLESGDKPLRLEPVTATITINRAGNPTAYVCDHAGIRTQTRIPMIKGILNIDTSQTKTIYYEVVYE